MASVGWKVLGLSGPAPTARSACCATTRRPVTARQTVWGQALRRAKKTAGVGRRRRDAGARSTSRAKHGPRPPGSARRPATAGRSPTCGRTARRRRHGSRRRAPDRKRYASWRPCATGPRSRPPRRSSPGRARPGGPHPRQHCCRRTPAPVAERGDAPGAGEQQRVAEGASDVVGQPGGGLLTHPWDGQVGHDEESWMFGYGYGYGGSLRVPHGGSASTRDRGTWTVRYRVSATKATRTTTCTSALTVTAGR